MTISYEDAKTRLTQNGQSHLLAAWPQLDESQRRDLLRQIESLDFDGIAAMRKTLAAASRAAPAAASTIEPAEVVQLAGRERSDAVRRGEEALRANRVGAILVAGGQGSRLGFEGPKGAFPIGPITKAPLFAVHARKIRALERKYACRIPFYVMTSPLNHEATGRFFAENRFFGLEAERVRFFAQAMWPALHPDGRIVREAPGRLFMSPDGHGGLLNALRASGELDDMARRGVTALFYFQVDNPLVEIADPAFVGLHTDRRADVSVKVCAKRDPDEGLGVVVTRDGRNAIVEYTELTAEQKRATGPDGRLRFLYGSVAIHIFSREFLEREARRDLPLHVAHKKVPYWDPATGSVKPDQPNAYKFERFIFDVLPDADRVLNVAFERAEEFSPVKNATGPDSPDTARRDMERKFARWLEACGVAVPRDEKGDPKHRIEVDPCYALGPDDLRARIGRGFRADGDVLLQ